MSDPAMKDSKVFEQFPFKRGKFNGKGKAHWEREAKKLVVEMLVRASMIDRSSLIGALAAERLEALARAESEELYAEVIGERDRCQEGFARIMGEIIGSPAP